MTQRSTKGFYRFLVPGRNKNIHSAFPLLLALFGGLSLIVQDALAQSHLTKTPSDYEGPFYPVKRQVDEDNDFIQVMDRGQQAKGDILNLSGVVVNTQGQPQKEVTVEIWQTDPKGRYNDPRDTSSGKRDPNFQYWGKTVTDKDGIYIFKTLIPGKYPPRPAHIHFKVWVAGKEHLTSQIYMEIPSDKKKSNPSISPRQMMNLLLNSQGEYEGFFQIVI